MDYRHTQRGRLHLYLHATGVILLLGALLYAATAWIAVSLGLTALLVFGLALSFTSLTVQDEGTQLAIRFGPLPLFGQHIPYAAMTAVEPGRTSFIDGYGIHCVPGRGTTYNLWGSPCAVIRLGEKTIRVGSDDVDNLVSFLRRKLEAAA